ncbi:MAG: copper chaperone, partial [Brucella anthropi]
AKSVTMAIQSVDSGAKVDTNPTERAVKVETTATLASVLKVLEEAGYPATAN